MTEFREELQALINSYCMENESDTPDFLLAAYLIKCLDAYNECVMQRDQWLGRPQ